LQTTSVDVYAIRAAAEQERRRREEGSLNLTRLPEEIGPWLKEVFPEHFTYNFAPRHEEFWDWIAALQKNVYSRPFIGIWGRGGTKSTSAESAVVHVGAEKKRKYVWYVSGTQEKADSHVANIDGLLTAQKLTAHYPELGKKALNKHGTAKGWRRNRLSTAHGMTVDALGLDTSSRGIKFEEQRPDFIVLDDVDDLEDSIEIVEKKIKKITQSILPSGSSDCAVLFIQNLIHEDSIASRLVDGRADFLLDRIVSGPFPAIIDLVWEYQPSPDDPTRNLPVIISGTPTWEGQDIETCQAQMRLWGPSAFLKEAQHDVEVTGGIWDGIIWAHVKPEDLPDMVKTVVWVDPAITTTDNSDCMGIDVGGVDNTSRLYWLDGWEGITTPEDALERAIRFAYTYGCQYVGIETDQGGDTWKSVFLRALDRVVAERKEYYESLGEKDPAKPPDYRFDKAGAGYGSKAERNLQLLTYYEQGEVVHVIGHHAYIEKALRRFPKKPLDLADAWWWCYRDLVDIAGWLQYAKRRAQNAQNKN
jgi:hypothetical protein